MAKFKVGDRVRVTQDRACGSTVRAGDLGTVYSPEHILMDSPRGVSRRKYDGFDWYIPDCNLELVERLKLEVGATVTIGDGKDEWEVVYVGLGTQVRRGPVFLNTDKKNLTVVKAKPEPPKPADEYENAAGPRRPGDVYEVRASDGAKYLWLALDDGDHYALATRIVRPSDFGPSWPRTLVSRDGKPYPGNV